MKSNILHAENLSKIYGIGKNEFLALDKINLDVVEGEFVCIMGPSGSGKSTLLYELSTVDIPEKGKVEIAGVNVRGMHEVALGQFRSENLGFIFQEFNLIDCLTIRENIALPLTLHVKKAADVEARVVEVATKLGVETLLDRFPNECSGGQRQRIASARALIANPKLVVADEPSGNLDSKNSHELLKLLTDLNEADGITILMVTHDPMIASYSKKLLFLKDGKIEQAIDRNGLSRKDFYYRILDITSKDSQALFEETDGKNVAISNTRQVVDMIVEASKAEGKEFSFEMVNNVIGGANQDYNVEDIAYIKGLYRAFVYLGK